MKRGGDIMSVHQMLVIRIRPLLSVFIFFIFGKFYTKNWSCDQILVIFTKNWSCNQFQLSFRPNFGKVYQKLVRPPISIVFRHQASVEMQGMALTVKFGSNFGSQIGICIECNFWNKWSTRLVCGKRTI